MAVFDEEPSKERYSGGSFLTVSLKKTNLAPILNRKPMIMVGSNFQPAIPPCNQPPYDEEDLSPWSLERLQPLRSRSEPTEEVIVFE